MDTVLVIEDRESFAKLLSCSLRNAGYQVLVAKDGGEGITLLQKQPVDIVVTDLQLPVKDGMEVLYAVRAHHSHLPVIMMTAHGSIEKAVKAVKEGAYDFISKPFEPDHLILQIEKALEKRQLLNENVLLKEGQLQCPKMIGESMPMKRVMEQARKVAPEKATVLLMGESGTGKEVFARSIHLMSSRSHQMFVAINCAAIPHDLLESELFGHEKGAFTGAFERKIGKFEAAHKGTLFLDEIGDLDIALQAKLLRVIEEGELMRVGGTHVIKLDVRIIAATNKNLTASIEQNKFREDLYYRLNVFSITIPPLRERKEDIPALVTHFLAHFSKEMKVEGKHVSPEAMAHLMAHPWRGNIRQMQNSIERALILCDGDTLLPEHFGFLSAPPDRSAPSPLLEGTLEEVGDHARQCAESQLIRKVLKETGGNKTKAADRLKVSYKTLLTKAKAYGIDAPGTDGHL